MAVSYPIEQTSGGYNHGGTVAKSSRPRHYDSFVVRLWQDEESDAMLRVEVQHVQAGLSVEGVQVPLDWILPEITSCLQTARGAQADDPLADDAR
jgi:hypothetical protein